MSTKVVNYPKGAKACPVKLTSDSTKKYAKTHYSAWDHYKEYKGSKKSNKTSPATNFLNFFNSFITPALNLGMLGAGIKMNTQNLKNFQQVNQTPTTTNPPAELKLGDEANAKAVQEDLNAMYTARTSGDKTPLNETFIKNKDLVKNYSAQLLTLSQTDIKDYDTDKDGKISLAEYQKKYTDLNGPLTGTAGEEKIKQLGKAFNLINIHNNDKDNNLITDEEYATFMASADTNADGKIEAKEMEAFTKLTLPGVTDDDTKKSLKRSIFINQILFPEKTDTK